MRLIKFLPSVIALIVSMFASAQVNQKKYDLFDLNKKGKLQVINRTLSSFMDKRGNGVKFSEANGDGVA